MVRGLGEMLDLLDVEILEIAQEGADEGSGVFGERNTGFLSTENGLVVHVGEVHHLGHLVAKVAQAAPQQVLEAEGAEVADVSIVVDGGAAGVDADLAGDEGAEDLE